MGGWRSIRLIEVALLVAAAAFFAFIDPYDATEDLSFAPSFLYWFATMAIFAGVAEIAVRIYLRRVSNRQIWGALSAAAIGSAVAITAFIIIVQIMRGDPVNETFWFQLFWMVLVISIVLVGLAFLTFRALVPAKATDHDPVAEFLTSLPVRFHHAELHAIASEDHYLRIYTDAGEAMIRMRLSDAVRELSAADGLQTHRSWWVHKPYVKDAQRQDGKLILLIPDEVAVPVSRNFMKSVKAAGLGV